MPGCHPATLLNSLPQLSGIATHSRYYTLHMLIIENKSRQAIYDAHIYEFPNKIMYGGKLHSYKDFQFEKKQVFSDDFLLNSTHERFIRNEYGKYDIKQEEE